jgi:hypothetical protein
LRGHENDANYEADGSERVECGEEKEVAGEEARSR